MPNERGAAQKLIPVPASDDFIKKLMYGFANAGFSSRSQFIRDAIVEKLTRMGIPIPPELALAPDRVRKTGATLMEAKTQPENPSASSKRNAALNKYLRAKVEKIRNNKP